MSEPRFPILLTRAQLLTLRAALSQAAEMASVYRTENQNLESIEEQYAAEAEEFAQLDAYLARVLRGVWEV